MLSACPNSPTAPDQLRWQRSHINHGEVCERAVINRAARSLTDRVPGRPLVIYQHAPTPDAG